MTEYEICLYKQRLCKLEKLGLISDEAYHDVKAYFYQKFREAHKVVDIKTGKVIRRN